jgi:hypothetical protein
LTRNLGDDYAVPQRKIHRNVEEVKEVKNEALPYLFDLFDLFDFAVKFYGGKFSLMLGGLSIQMV